MNIHMSFAVIHLVNASHARSPLEGESPFKSDRAGDQEFVIRPEGQREVTNASYRMSASALGDFQLSAKETIS
jgi:hypothetical protein